MFMTRFSSLVLLLWLSVCTQAGAAIRVVSGLSIPQQGRNPPPAAALLAPDAAGWVQPVPRDPSPAGRGGALQQVAPGGGAMGGTM